jgi:hypothetical protein
MGSIIPHIVYAEIERIALAGGDPSEARSIIKRFRRDLASAKSYETKASLRERLAKLRQHLATSNQRHPDVDFRVFQEAIDAVDEGRIEKPRR